MALLLHLKLYVIKRFNVYVIFLYSGHETKRVKSRRAIRHLAATDGGHAENCLEQFLPWLLDSNIFVADGLDLLSFIPFPSLVVAS